MAERKFTVTAGAATSAILVAVLVVSVIGSVGTNGAAQPSIDGEAVQSADDPEVADEIYVKDNGDAVLVYKSDEGESDDELRTMDLGVSVSEGLAHVLIEGNSSGIQDNASGGLTLMLDRNSFTGDGTFSMDQPENLKSLTLDASAERTSETNTFDAKFDATLANDGQSPALQSFETSGDMTVTSDTLRTTGEFAAESAVPLGERAYDVSVSGTETGYTISATQSHPVSEYQKDSWNSREAAKRTLEDQFDVNAEAFGGSSSVTIDSYSFEQASGSRYNLDVSYTVEYANVKDGVAAALEQQLAQDSELDLSDDEAAAVAQSVVGLELRTLDASVEVDGQTASGSWAVEIGNYDEALRTALEVGESHANDENVTDSIDQVRTMLDAQKAADLKQTLEWSGSVTTSEDQVDVSAEISSNSENWAAYVDELEANGVNAAQNDVSMEISAETDGDRLSSEMSMNVEQEDLVSTMVDSVVQSAAQNPTADEETQRILTRLKNSEFQTGKLDVSVDSESVTIEAGAKFDNLSALGQQINDAYGGHTVTQMAGRLGSENGGELHVHVDGLVESGAGEEDVRSLAVADSDTEIKTGGDYDRSFHTMDTDRAKQFLGLDGGSGSDEKDSDSSLPGFGPAVATVALVGAALIARRRD